MREKINSWKFSATWVKYGSDKSRRNFTEIHLVMCFHLDATCIHLRQRMNLTPCVTCPSSDTGFCSHNAWVDGTSAAEPTEEPADFWELEVTRILFVLPMKCSSATASIEGWLLLVTAWTEKIWGRKWQQLSAHFALFWCFKVCRGGTLTWSHIFNYLDHTFNPVL